MLKDAGRGSRALDGFFPGAPHEGWLFPSTPISPYSLGRQSFDTSRGFFFVGGIAHWERCWSGREEGEGYRERLGPRKIQEDY